MRTMTLAAQAFFLLAAFLAGALGYLVLSTLAPTSSLFRLLVSAGTAIYHQIGIVSLGLAPLGIYLLFLTSKMVLQGQKEGQKTHPPRKALEFVIEAAPMLGILGTMISLGGAMSSIDLSQGLPEAIRGMSYQVGQALNSSILGITMALLAFVLKHLGGGEQG